MTAPDFVQRTLSIWLNKYPENTTYEVDHILEHRHPAKLSDRPTHRKAAVRFRKIGDPAMFALIGATFKPEDTDHLLIKVHVSEDSQNTTPGLPPEFAREVFSTAVIQAYIQSGEVTSLGPGTLSFDCAQTHPVDSSPFSLKLTTQYVTRLLMMPEITNEVEVFEYLRSNQDPSSNSEQFIAGLFGACEHEDILVRCKAISTMGLTRNPIFQQTLLNALQSDNLEIKRTAIKGLGDAKDKAIVQHLIPLLTHDDLTVRLWTALTLRKLEWFPEAKAERIQSIAAQRQWNDLIEFGDKAIPFLIEGFQKSTDINVIDAIHALEKLVDDSVILPLLAEKLESLPADKTDWQTQHIRQAIISTVKEINTPEAQELLNRWNSDEIVD